ncbi:MULTISPECIES: GNAT family N-acetyltransferase [Vagococcus]|uniref:Acetyltransferase (GNAT family) SAS0976 n=1 Tax=Vagococcus fluvialis bH819 TaxID=1255619 RepID=A0A1X6WMB5_9ENTE|nr:MULTISPECIES: GNAT family N-acetyltransferase [Vagococcus]SLM85407.1 Acetyltransferase (GNAT family) SAS0976 [Vagococcus fluvialis bH819]HCM89300.1 N-acetyltransferase [Vagococcus sp.]
MIRSAEPKDANEAMDLVMIVLRDMELDVFNKLAEDDVKKLLIKAFIKEPNYRYGFNNAIVKEIDGHVAGVAFGYPDHLEKNIDDAFINLLLNHNLSEEYKLFHDEETFKDEWYLDTLVTSPDFRGKGVARELLDSLPYLAKKHNRNKLGLNVDTINESARRIYLNNGFEKVGQIEISNHDYDHLQKLVD